MKFKFSIISLTILLFSCTSQIEDTLYSINGTTMGTTFSIKFTSKNIINAEELKIEINGVLAKVNKQMSTYIPNSELSLFNKFNDTTWVSVSHDLAYVVTEALEISEKTNGLFDITVGPLVNLWGFGPRNKPQTIPTEKEIQKNRQRIGYKNISVRLSPPSIKKAKTNIYCDLSSIAKGFGVDKVSEYLTNKGIINYLVEIGGELRASGSKFGKNWRVGISVPNKTSTIQEILSLSNNAMATSGDYWNYFEENGVRYSHTINPKTGKPISHKLASVTIVAESCMKADAIATAIDVMGPKLGLDFAKENKLKAYFIVKVGDKFDTFFTPQFKSLIIREN